MASAPRTAESMPHQNRRNNCDPSRSFMSWIPFPAWLRAFGRFERKLEDFREYWPKRVDLHELRARKPHQIRLTDYETGTVDHTSGLLAAFNANSNREVRVRVKAMLRGRENITHRFCRLPIVADIPQPSERLKAVIHNAHQRGLTNFVAPFGPFKEGIICPSSSYPDSRRSLSKNPHLDGAPADVGVAVMDVEGNGKWYWYETIDLDDRDSSTQWHEGMVARFVLFRSEWSEYLPVFHFWAERTMEDNSTGWMMDRGTSKERGAQKQPKKGETTYEVSLPRHKRTAVDEGIQRMESHREREYENEMPATERQRKEVQSLKDRAGMTQLGKQHSLTTANPEIETQVESDPDSEQSEASAEKQSQNASVRRQLREHTERQQDAAARIERREVAMEEKRRQEKLEERKNREEEKGLEELKKLDEQKRLDEQRKLEEQKRLEEQRFEEKRRLDEQREREAEEQKKLEEQKKHEEEESRKELEKSMQRRNPPRGRQTAPAMNTREFSRLVHMYARQIRSTSAINDVLDDFSHFYPALTRALRGGNDDDQKAKEVKKARISRVGSVAFKLAQISSGLPASPIREDDVEYFLQELGDDESPDERSEDDLESENDGDDDDDDDWDSGPSQSGSGGDDSDNEQSDHSERNQADSQSDEANSDQQSNAVSQSSNDVEASVNSNESQHEASDNFLWLGPQIETYLDPDFDTSKLKVVQLRKALLWLNIPFPSDARKPKLLNLFRKEFLPLAIKLSSNTEHFERSVRGIIDVPSSLGNHALGMDDEEEEGARETNRPLGEYISREDIDDEILALFKESPEKDDRTNNLNKYVGTDADSQEAFMAVALQQDQHFNDMSSPGKTYQFPSVSSSEGSRCSQRSGRQAPSNTLRDNPGASEGFQAPAPAPSSRSSLILETHVAYRENEGDEGDRQSSQESISPKKNVSWDDSEEVRHVETSDPVFIHGLPESHLEWRRKNDMVAASENADHTSRARNPMLSLLPSEIKIKSNRGVARPKPLLPDVGYLSEELAKFYCQHGTGSIDDIPNGTGLKAGTAAHKRRISEPSNADSPSRPRKRSKMSSDSTLKDLGRSNRSNSPSPEPRAPSQSKCQGTRLKLFDNSYTKGVGPKKRRKYSSGRMDFIDRPNSAQSPEHPDATYPAKRRSITIEDEILSGPVQCRRLGKSAKIAVGKPQRSKTLRTPRVNRKVATESGHSLTSPVDNVTSQALSYEPSTSEDLPQTSHSVERSTSSKASLIQGKLFKSITVEPMPTPPATNQKSRTTRSPTAVTNQPLRNGRKDNKLQGSRAKNAKVIASLAEGLRTRRNEAKKSLNKKEIAKLSSSHTATTRNRRKARDASKQSFSVSQLPTPLEAPVARRTRSQFARKLSAYVKEDVKELEKGRR